MAQQGLFQVTNRTLDRAAAVPEPSLSDAALLCQYFIYVLALLRTG